MGTTPKDASGNTDALVGLDCAARKCPVGWCGRLDELCPGQYSAGWVQCTGCSACQEVEAQAREHIAQIQSCSDHDTCVVTTISSGGFDVFQLYCRTPFYQRQGADTKLETLKTLSEKWNKACRRGFFVDCESPGPEPAPGACIQGKCQAQPNADRG
ncbi:MAG: hypothetical protein IPG96_08035 [Proteobacteria bacterium]|nr:hypothetical protein [Pseudomonadota bacterium]